MSLSVIAVRRNPTSEHAVLVTGCYTWDQSRLTLTTRWRTFPHWSIAEPEKMSHATSRDTVIATVRWGTFGESISIIFLSRENFFQSDKLFRKVRLLTRFAIVHGELIHCKPSDIIIRLDLPCCIPLSRSQLQMYCAYPIVGHALATLGCYLDYHNRTWINWWISASRVFIASQGL